MLVANIPNLLSSSKHLSAAGSELRTRSPRVSVSVSGPVSSIWACLTKAASIIMLPVYGASSNARSFVAVSKCKILTMTKNHEQILFTDDLRDGVERVSEVGGDHGEPDLPDEAGHAHPSHRGLGPG